MDAKLNRETARIAGGSARHNSARRQSSRKTSPIGRRREKGNGEKVEQYDKESNDEETGYCSSCFTFLRNHSAAAHAIVGILWILFGVTYFCVVEHCYVLTGFYFITQVVTTIGYGDVTPTTNVGKFITTFYALGTILYLGSLINLLIDTLNEKVVSLETGHSPSLPGDNIMHKVKDFFENSVLPLFGMWRSAITAFLKFMFLVLLGTVFYATYEKCTCSYGIDTIQGCIDTSFATCAATGGDTKTWTDSFYMCIITLTTVGFGDFTPMSYLGRLLFIPWAFLGVVSMANFATNFAVALTQATLLPKERTEDELRANLTAMAGDRETFNEIDFIMFFLQVNDRIPKSQMTSTIKVFQQMDKDGTGQISEDDALRYVQHHQDTCSMYDDEQLPQ